MGLYNTHTCSSGSPRMLRECPTAWLLTAVPRCAQRLRSLSNWGAFCVFSLASFSAVWSATQALCALRSGHGDWNSYAEDPRSIFSPPGKQSPPLVKELRSTTMSLLQGRLLFFLLFQFLGFLFSFLFRPLPLPDVLYSFLLVLAPAPHLPHLATLPFSPMTVVVPQIQDLHCICSSLQLPSTHRKCSSPADTYSQKKSICFLLVQASFPRPTQIIFCRINLSLSTVYQKF